MPSIPVVNPLGYIGVFLVMAGFFLVIAGIELIKIEKLTITPGRKTWGIGLLLTAIGVLFLLPDIHSAISPSTMPTTFDTVAPNTTPSPVSASPFAATVQPTSEHSIHATATQSSIPLSQGLATASPQFVACVTSQSGAGATAEVQADSLISSITNKPKLPLVNGEEIPFSDMKSIEIIQVSEDYPIRVRAKITLLNGDIVTEDARYPMDDLRGTAKYGSFSISLYEMKRVEFREQGGCQ